MNPSIFTDVWDISEKPLSMQEALQFVAAPAHGATNLFTGTVRDLNFGRTVEAVSYDVFEPLAKESFRAICEEAQAQWNPLRLYIAHAKGRLPVGGLSIVIAAGTTHRDEAFKACRYVIEAIKHQSPIWKKEFYSDGESEWVKGHALCSHA